MVLHPEKQTPSKKKRRRRRHTSSFDQATSKKDPLAQGQGLGCCFGYGNRLQVAKTNGCAMAPCQFPYKKERSAVAFVDDRLDNPQVMIQTVHLTGEVNAMVFGATSLGTVQFLYFLLTIQLCISQIPVELVLNW